MASRLPFAARTNATRSGYGFAIREADAARISSAASVLTIRRDRLDPVGAVPLDHWGERQGAPTNPDTGCRSSVDNWTLRLGRRSLRQYVACRASFELTAPGLGILFQPVFMAFPD